MIEISQNENGTYKVYASWVRYYFNKKGLKKDESGYLFEEAVKGATREDFFQNTIATFSVIKTNPRRKPDFVSHRKLRILASVFDEFVQKEDSFLYIKPNDDEYLGEYEVLFYDAEDASYVVKDMDDVSSVYYYTVKGVYRYSNHWGKCASCYWEIAEETAKIGFCPWENFYKQK